MHTLIHAFHFAPASPCLAFIHHSVRGGGLLLLAIFAIVALAIVMVVTSDRSK